MLEAQSVVSPGVGLIARLAHRPQSGHMQPFLRGLTPNCLECAGEHAGRVEIAGHFDPEHLE